MTYSVIDGLVILLQRANSLFSCSRLYNCDIFMQYLQVSGILSITLWPDGIGLYTEGTQVAC